uniref:Uncharacterized protein n=1 Tax=Gossypium raimondii TaxID=29730 RepID=A0A0D2V8V6_GOSRA|nr:hypothetical protein B456_013G050800 [Gossypium raimondii]
MILQSHVHLVLRLLQCFATLLSQGREIFVFCWPFLFPSFLSLNWLLLINCFIPLFSQGSAELDFLATIIPGQGREIFVFCWPFLFPSFLSLNWLLLINCFIPLFSQGSAELDFLATIIPVHNIDNQKEKSAGAFRESNSGPLAPKARIIPLDQMPNV